MNWFFWYKNNQPTYCISCFIRQKCFIIEKRLGRDDKWNTIFKIGKI